ncbi:CYFA0S05e00848g1_1 [Cyberlindnera fabianii]|nr:CYFA0S05e00848g1_1 [Cyberlindnera fabianii]
MKFYTPVDIETQMELLRQVYQLVSQRSMKQSSFLTAPPLLEGIDEIKVIYRQYATLYFVFIVDEQESELGILDLIQVFVQSLDRCFENVCELDLVFGWQTLQTVLEEIIQGGMVIETNISAIVAAVDEANNQQGLSSVSAVSAFANASSAFGAFKQARIPWPSR